MSTHASQSHPHTAAEEIRHHLVGFGIAGGLTVLAFALVLLHPVSTGWIFTGLAVLAIVQVLVQFRYFLHLDFTPEKRDGLAVLLFTLLLLAIMAAGTIWVLGDLMARMM